MNQKVNHRSHLAAPVSTRREVLQAATQGLGALALASVCGFETARAAKDSSPGPAGTPASSDKPLAPRPTHFAARAKRVILMFMQGGPSQIDTFDEKPLLAKYAGSSTPAGAAPRGRLLESPWKFPRSGQSGLPISELFPELAGHADDLCLLNGMHTDNPAHPQATLMMNTGAINFVRPSMGAWVVYGLGTMNENLPGFVTLHPQGLPGGGQNYGSAFLPATYQGTSVLAGGPPMSNLRNPRRTGEEQRRQLDFIQSLNHDYRRQHLQQPELDGIIDSYELAFRMQAAVPELMDLTSEPARVRAEYGMESQATREFGAQCLMARRLAEAGVRFIQLNHRGWDQHNGLRANLAKNAQGIDRPIATLLADLKQRGMLQDTLVVWTGEFGRTPQDQGNGDGRRHNHRGFTTWLAGAGLKGGVRYGATDETGAEAVEGRVHVHDLHATILHLLGLDHERLTYHYSGRDFRLTDTAGRVVEEIL